jgi:hypothetical protein
MQFKSYIFRLDLDVEVKDRVILQYFECTVLGLTIRHYDIFWHS